MVTTLETSSPSSTEEGSVSMNDLAGHDQKILVALRDGQTPEEVATSLGIPVGDVRQRQNALKNTLGAESLPQLRQMADQTGWCDWQAPDPSNSSTGAP